MLSRVLLFVVLSTALMLFTLHYSFDIFPIAWGGTYGFCTIDVDSVLLCYVFSIFLCNNGQLLMKRTGYLGMMYVTMLPTVTELLVLICYCMYWYGHKINEDE